MKDMAVHFDTGRCWVAPTQLQRAAAALCRSSHCRSSRGPDEAVSMLNGTAFGRRLTNFEKKHYQETIAQAFTTLMKTILLEFKLSWLLLFSSALI